MGRIPDRVIEEIRERADISQVVGRYVTLKKAGNRYWGLCPFHSEKTPSFTVHADKQMFHCFGCGEGGDVFGFRMKVDAAGFMDTVRALAQEFSVELPSSASSERESRSAPLYRANEIALEYFREGLRSNAGAAARRYLEERSTPADLIDRFQLGFAPAGWDGLLKRLRREGVALKDAEQAGLIVPRQTGDGHYDRFRARVIFPIHEPNGRVVGFGGRALGDDTPKYLNSSETPIYRKGGVLFGLHNAIDGIRQRGRVIVVEGYFDLVALHRAGINEGVAPCGTALTTDHARRLRRYTREVILLFDGDEAGRRAAERSLPILAAESMRVRAAFLPDGQDPDTLLDSEGTSALVECIEGATPLLDRLIDDRLGMRPLHEWEAADVSGAFGPLISAVPDRIERAAYVRRIATRIGLDATTVGRALQTQNTGNPGRSERVAEPQSAPSLQLDPTQRTLLAALGAHPELVSVLDEFSAEISAQGAELVHAVIQALRDRGREGLTQLLSDRESADQPDSHALPEAARSALRQTLAEADLDDKAIAEQALRDCLAQMRIRELDREAKSVSLKLESCHDRAEEDSLLVRKQQILRERSDLAGQVNRA